MAGATRRSASKLNNAQAAMDEASRRGYIRNEAESMGVCPDVVTFDHTVRTDARNRPYDHTTTQPHNHSAESGPVCVGGRFLKCPPRSCLTRPGGTLERTLSAELTTFPSPASCLTTTLVSSVVALETASIKTLRLPAYL
ncbi:hypothetical protein J1614_006307 [Plenodomus biglobosus]|nr:hypothetical protein J1614_006307 [Plenodomus biglobosus]